MSSADQRVEATRRIEEERPPKPAAVIIALGHDLGASMVMAGAYARLSGVVGIDALVEGMRESIPSYRTQHVAANETAIQAGYERVKHLAAPAWEGATV